MGWITLGNKVTGTSHGSRAIPCQDAFGVRTFGKDKESLAIVVADGAGSAPHSELGATKACDEIVRLVDCGLPNPLDRDTIMEVLKEARSAICREAEERGLLARDLACTAVLTIATPERTVFAQVGDGAIVFRNADDYDLAFWPESAEYANATNFLTDDSFAECVLFRCLEGSPNEVAVLTDGLQRLALDFATRTPFAPFFQPLFKELRLAGNPEALMAPLHAFLDSEKVNERTDDDKTLVFAIRHP
ncbi:MAG: PP2C family serine/threonine-protein phosphatase [Gemmataceae bacterium]